MCLGVAAHPSSSRPELQESEILMSLVLVREGLRGAWVVPSGHELSHPGTPECGTWRSATSAGCRKDGGHAWSQAKPACMPSCPAPEPPGRTSLRCISFFFKFFFCLFRATPTAYGGSQARGQIRAAAASLYYSHGNARSELNLPPTSQLVAMLDP